MQEESDISCNTTNKIKQFEEFTDTSERVDARRIRHKLQYNEQNRTI